MQADAYKKYLKIELLARCERNPKYSLRAFARALSLDPGTLSKVISGKKIPSFRLSQKLMHSLDLSPEEKKLFFGSIAAAHRKRSLGRLNPVFKKTKEPVLSQSALDTDLYHAISDWFYLAIVELTDVESFNPDPKWIASELGISQIEARLAIDRLCELKLLERKNGTLKKALEQTTSADKGISTPALRKRQKEALKKAEFSLENDPIETRSMTTMTMAIDPKKIPIAKQMIGEFNRALCQFLESGKKLQVYELGVSLYPLQKGRSK